MEEQARVVALLGDWVHWGDVYGGYWGRGCLRWDFGCRLCSSGSCSCSGRESGTDSGRNKANILNSPIPIFIRLIRRNIGIIVDNLDPIYALPIRTLQNPPKRKIRFGRRQP